MACVKQHPVLLPSLTCQFAERARCRPSELRLRPGLHRIWQIICEAVSVPFDTSTPGQARHKSVLAPVALCLVQYSIGHANLL